MTRQPPSRRSRVEEVIREQVQGALLSTRREWTTSSLKLSTDRIVEGVMPIVLAEVRKARGRTVGYVNVTEDAPRDWWLVEVCRRLHNTGDPSKLDQDDRRARVVLVAVPRRRRKK